MLLAIDAGNTDTVFAIFEGEKLCATWRLSTHPLKTADEFAALLMPLADAQAIRLKDIRHAVIATVVPQHLFALKTFCRTYCGQEPDVVGENGFLPK
ncbi:MAG: type III pantothenate kinase, partial [Rickettsiales bacterium]|nr:type III pantothenate kinase [Rickettsiales bacterium]